MSVRPRSEEESAEKVLNAFKEGVLDAETLSPPDPFRKKVPFQTGAPCNHPGCLSHVTHPCEVCGRTRGGMR